MPALTTEQTYATLEPRDSVELVEPDMVYVPHPQGEEGKSLINKVKSLLRRQRYIPRGLSLVLPGQAHASVVEARRIAEHIAQQAINIVSLETVHVKVTPWGFECWLVTNHSTKEERFILYDIEWLVMEHMPDKEFKFHHIERNDRPIDEIVTLTSDAAVSLH